MKVALGKPSWLQRLKPVFEGFDLPLILIVLCMCGLGLVNMYSVGFDHGTRFVDHDDERRQNRAQRRKRVDR